MRHKLHFSKNPLRRGLIFDHSVKVAARWSKDYFPRYRKDGKWIVVDSEPLSSRDAAEQRGLELQALEDARAKAETERIRAELAAQEAQAQEQVKDETYQ